MSNEEKTNDYENFEKEMIYMKILKKGGVVEKRGEEETKSKPHAPVDTLGTRLACNLRVGFDIKEGVNYTDLYLNLIFINRDIQATGAWGMDFVSSSPLFTTTPPFFKIFI